MQRYKAKIFEGVIVFDHDDNGKWVKYEDVKLWIETKPPEITIESIECNCEELCEVPYYNHRRFGSEGQSWLCPAHGYKRL